MHTYIHTYILTYIHNTYIRVHSYIHTYIHSNEIHIAVAMSKPNVFSEAHHAQAYISPPHYTWYFDQCHHIFDLPTTHGILTSVIIYLTSLLHMVF